LEDEVGSWRAEGIRTVVCLLERDEARELGLEREGGFCRQRGMEFLAFPIADRGVPGSSREAGELIGRIAADLREGRNVGVLTRLGPRRVRSSGRSRPRGALRCRTRPSRRRG
jgi:hypothetical protein